MLVCSFLYPAALGAGHPAPVSTLRTTRKQNPATDSISGKRTLRSLSQGHVQGHAPALWAPGWCPFCLVGSSGCSGDSMSFGGTISCYVFCPHDGGAVWGEPHIPKSNEWTFPHPRAPRTGLSQWGAEILTEERVSGAVGAGGGGLVVLGTHGLLLLHCSCGICENIHRRSRMNPALLPA